MSSLYRTILHDAWRITWNKRWLWLFGLFAAFLGSGGEYNLIVKNITTIQNEGAFLTSLSAVVQQSGAGVWYETLAEVAGNLNVASIGLLLVTLVVVLAILVIAFMSQGALISGAFRTYKGSATNMQESWKRGRTKLKEIFALNVIGKVVLYIVFVVLGLPVLYLFLQTHNLVWQWILVMISFLVFVPLAIIVSFLVKYAVIFAVAKNNDVRLALHESWHLFRKHWMVSLEMALILFAVNMLVGVAMIIGLMVISIPFVILAFIGVYMNITMIFWFATVLGSLVAFAGIFTAGAMLSTFQTTSWVVLFERLTEGVMIPKIMRLAAELPERLRRSKS